MVYLDPFEIINNQILPAFRKEVVLFLKDKMPRKEIARVLDLSEVAVHYYLKGERGNSFRFNAKEKTEIKRIAKEFLKNKDVFVLKRGFKKLTDDLFKNKRICSICGRENCNC